MNLWQEKPEEMTEMAIKNLPPGWKKLCEEGDLDFYDVPEEHRGPASRRAEEDYFSGQIEQAETYYGKER